MGGDVPRASFQYDIKSLLVLTAFVAVSVQLSVVIWTVLPVRLPYVVYGLHLLWTGSWLAVVLSAAWLLVQTMRPINLEEHSAGGVFESVEAGRRKELRRQFLLAVGWGFLNNLLWFSFTLSVVDSDAQWFLAIVYLQVLPAAWVSHGLQFRRYFQSPDVLLRVMYFANLAGFVLPILTLPYSIARSLGVF